MPPRIKFYDAARYQAILDAQRNPRNSRTGASLAMGAEIGIATGKMHARGPGAQSS